MRKVIYFILLMILVVIPGIRLLGQISYLVTLKNRINILGTKKALFKYQKKSLIPHCSIFIGIIVIVIFLCKVSKSYYPLCLIFSYLPIFMSVVIVILTSKYNGIYEHGIVFGVITKWSKIESYNIKTETLVLQLKNNRTITLKSIENKNDVEAILSMNVK